MNRRVLSVEAVASILGVMVLVCGAAGAGADDDSPAPAMLSLPMLALHGIPLVLQVGVPLALLAWQALAGNRSISEWLLKTVAIAGYLAAAHRIGLWAVLPWYTALVLLVALTAMALSQLRSVRKLPWKSARPRWPALVGRASLALLTLVILATAVTARQAPSETIVDLQFPLRDGVYYVAAGGSRELLNPHLMTLTHDRLHAFRGQSYGVDLLKLGAFGLRASGLLPGDPGHYAIYGDPVFAPCPGVVVQAEDGAPDMRPPEPDRTRMPGNHVLLDCGGVHVLLAHFKQGSVRVARSEQVATGTLLGLVGNSGNSNEPHLHIHAQRPAASGREPLSGDPLPIRLDGKYLVRNDRVASTQP